MFRKLLWTRNDYALTLVRLGLGIMILPHGAQKLLGWFGGHGFSGTMQYFTQAQGIPYVFALLAILAEFFGGLGLIAGFLGRIAALGVGATMAVAAAMVHLSNGFFMNWSGQQAGEGFEFHILAVAMALAVMIGGSGALSVDRALAKPERELVVPPVRERAGALV